MQLDLVGFALTARQLEQFFCAKLTVRVGFGFGNATAAAINPKAALGSDWNLFSRDSVNARLVFQACTA